MGLFVAQALTVLLGMTLVIVSLALLALVTAKASRNRPRAIKVDLTPARDVLEHMDCSIRTGIELQRAAPSRAPPPCDLRAPMDDPAELPPDDPVRP